MTSLEISNENEAEQLMLKVSEFTHLMRRLKVLLEGAQQEEYKAFQEVRRLQEKIVELTNRSVDLIEQQSVPTSSGATPPHSVREASGVKASLADLNLWLETYHKDYAAAECEWKRRTLETAECRAMIQDAIAEHNGESLDFLYQGEHSLEAAKPSRGAAREHEEPPLIAEGKLAESQKVTARPSSSSPSPKRIAGSRPASSVPIASRKPLIQAAYPAVDPRLDKNLQHIPIADDSVRTLFETLDPSHRGYVTAKETQDYFNRQSGGLPLMENFVVVELKKLIPFRERSKYTDAQLLDYRLSVQEFGLMACKWGNM
jgi:hypothetical protein